MDWLIEILLEVCAAIFGNAFEDWCAVIGKAFLPRNFIKNNPEEVNAIVAVTSILAALMLVASVFVFANSGVGSLLAWILLIIPVLYFGLGAILVIFKKKK